MAPGQTLADVYAAREPLYRRYADLTVDVGEGRGLEETSARVWPGAMAMPRVVMLCIRRSSSDRGTWR